MTTEEMLTNYKAELAGIDAQLATMTGGSGAQGYGISGRSINRVDYRALTDRKTALIGLISRLENGGGVTYPVFGAKG